MSGSSVTDLRRGPAPTARTTTPGFAGSRLAAPSTGVKAIEPLVVLGRLKAPLARMPPRGAHAVSKTRGTRISRAAVNGRGKLGLTSVIAYRCVPCRGHLSSDWPYRTVLPDAEDVLGLFAGHGARVPGWRPDQVDLDVAGTRPAGTDTVDLALEHRADRAARPGEGHLDLDVVLVDVDVVDQAEIDDVEPDLGVDHHLQPFHDLIGVDRLATSLGLVVGPQVRLLVRRRLVRALCLSHAMSPTV